MRNTALVVIVRLGATREQVREQPRAVVRVEREAGEDVVALDLGPIRSAVERAVRAFAFGQPVDHLIAAGLVTRRRAAENGVLRGERAHGVAGVVERLVLQRERDGYASRIPRNADLAGRR